MHRENELEEKQHHKIVKGCPEYIQGDPLKLPPKKSLVSKWEKITKFQSWPP